MQDTTKRQKLRLISTKERKFHSKITENIFIKKYSRKFPKIQRKFSNLDTRGT